MREFGGRHARAMGSQPIAHIYGRAANVIFQCCGGPRHIARKHHFHQSAMIVHAAGFRALRHRQVSVALALHEQHFPESQQPWGGAGCSERIVETPVPLLPQLTVARLAIRPAALY